MPPQKRSSPQKGPIKKQDRPKSRDSGRASRASTATTKVKESSVLTENSLAALAKEIGSEKLNGLVLCMYLNMPNTTIVNAANDASCNGLIEANDTTLIDVTLALLLTWKSLRCGSKEREKVKDLERALRDMGKGDVAEVISDKHANNVELTPDAFAN